MIVRTFVRRLRLARAGSHRGRSWKAASDPEVAFGVSPSRRSVLYSQAGPVRLQGDQYDFRIPGFCFQIHRKVFRREQPILFTNLRTLQAGCPVEN